MTCEWLRESHKSVANAALQKLDQIQLPNNAAVVFDIDHTLLDGAGNPIEPIVRLYNIVKNKRITPVIITARLGNQKGIEITQSQLSRSGIDSYKFLYFLHPNKRDPVQYKRIARKNVHERGLYVVMSIGDEYWDIGDYGGHGFIVPKCKYCLDAWK